MPSAGTTTATNAAPSVAHQAKVGYREAVSDPSWPAQATLAPNDFPSLLGMVEPVRAGHCCRIRICAISKLAFGMPGSNKSPMV